MHLIYFSRHLATRGNNKILRTPPPHISSSVEILSCLTHCTHPNSAQTNLPSSNHTYTKSTPNHIHPHYSPSATPTIPSTAPTFTPGFVDRPHWRDKLAGEPKVGWSDTPPPHTTRVNGVGKQQLQKIENSVYMSIIEAAHYSPNVTLRN